jgi:putative membrane-bound dehydrogenase-like protein
LNAAILSRPRVRFGLGLIVLLTWSATPRAAEWEDALKRFKVPEGFQVQCVASEPDVRKPVTITFDDRGRMWVIQYLQYPTPAGLKPVKVDQYLRTVYDRVPEPPPKGPQGIDRITILDDPGPDGRYRKVKDFHVGLNLASGMCLGHGGLFVVQPPYLLFYKIKDGEDVPTGDPEVLLSGFGMEDAHAFPNSLQWGPDGWLYGAQGSTVTANIRGIEFQQGIWRYHPITKEFELFAEGGGNTWGVDFDRHGQIIAGTNWGGQACLHQVQGGYYIKGFTKHGPLHNPYTFGYFDHIPYTGFTGGHVTCGGIVYQGGAFPEKYHNHYIAGNLLSSAIHWHILERKGSSFTARFGGELMTTDDSRFRPVDCLTGPDGAVYIADWCDKRANHVDPVDNWDRTRGRIWKLTYTASGGCKPPVDGVEKQGANAPRSPLLPLSKFTSKELLTLLSHPNDWYRREARRILAERRDASVVPALKKMVEESKSDLALEALWALYVSGGLDDATALRLLDHPSEDVRAWTVRLLCDARKVSPLLHGRLLDTAAKDPSARVRSQLACSAKRLPARECLQIVARLLPRKQDANDPHIPLLLWWAIESKVSSHRDGVLELAKMDSVWDSPLFQQFMLERLARRLMAEESYPACAQLLGFAHQAGNSSPVIAGMEKALEGRTLRQPPPALAQALDPIWRAQPSHPVLLRLMLRLGTEAAEKKAFALLGSSQTPSADRIALMEVVSQAGKPDCVPIFLNLFRESTDGKVRAAALTALQRFPDPAIPAAVLELYPKLPNDLRGRAQSLLCSRPTSALQFLKLVDAGTIDKKQVPLDLLQQVVLYKDEEITKLVEKHWGKIGAQSSGEKQSRIRSVALIIRRGKGDAVRGKELYTKNCATCHTLFNEGNKVGPELTGVDRKNLDFLVHSIVDPSAIVRPEFVAYSVATKDGRVLTGLIAEDSPKALTLLDAKNERTVIARDSIEEMNPLPQSLMPEKLLDSLDDQQICDLFAYLQGNEPAKPQAAPLKVLLISGSLEYKSDESLAEFQKFLEANYNVKCLRAFRKTDTDIPGLDQLDTCDVALFYTRRLQIDGEQLERIQKYCKAGKPIVALRTASHGFQKWLAMDKEVFGGNYSNHYKDGPLCEVKIVPKAKDHPILQGVKEYKSIGSLYKNPDIAKDCEVLLTGSIPDHTEPIAWTRVHNGGRVFYTSLGHQKDFTEESFRQLVVNALFWTAKRDVQKK